MKENILGERQEIFDFFNRFESPILGITAKIKTPNFLPTLKEKKISPFQWILYSLLQANLEIREFKLRVHQGEIYELKSLVPSYTVMREPGVFNYASFRLPEKFNFQDFLSISLKEKERAEKSEHLNHDDPTHSDYVFITCLPQIDFTSITHPIHNFKKSSIPSFAIGKFNLAHNNEELIFPLGIQGHHGFIDGLHLSLLIQKFQENLIRFEF